MKKTLLATAVAATIVSSYSQAAVINLIDVGGVTGSAAEKGFQAAADYWGKMFTNDAVINLSVRFAALNPGVIGSTGSSKQNFDVIEYTGSTTSFEYLSRRWHCWWSYCWCRR